MQRNSDRVKALFLFAVALVIRLFVITNYAISNIVYVPLEIALCLAALFFERKHLASFFISFRKWKSDLFLGFILAAVWCSVEYFFEGLDLGDARAFYWDSFFMIPVLVLLAGWRAGVYEELLFRSLLMGYLRLFSKNSWFFVLTQALVFWAAHPRYYMHGLWVQSATNFIFGLLLGIVVHKRSSILPAMVIHSIGNTYGVVGMPLVQAFSKALHSWLH